MPIDLYYMPFTHSLIGSIAWAVAAGAITAAFVERDRKLIAGAIVAALVFSHWLLDLVVHRHDLGVLDDEPHKLGFALWDWPRIEMPLELGLVVVGLWLYLVAAGQEPKSSKGRFAATRSRLIDLPVQINLKSGANCSPTASTTWGRA
jgi:hypothetical protein